MVIDTNQHLWIGYNNTITKNANTNGTWATASGFPVHLTGNQILAPLSDGGVYTVNYVWDVNGRSLGYISTTGSSTFTAEGNITALPVEDTASNANTYVGRIFADGLGDGIVHLVYQSTTGQIRYAQRNANGTWAPEVVLATGAEPAVSSPMLTFNPTNGDILVTWTAYNTLYCAVRHNNSWSSAFPVYSTSFEHSFEHAISSQLTDPSGTFLVNTLDSSYHLLALMVSVKHPTSLNATAAATASAYTTFQVQGRLTDNATTNHTGIGNATLTLLEYSATSGKYDTTVATTKTNNSAVALGAYTFSVKETTNGIYSYGASYAGTATYQSTTSAPVKVKVT